MKNFKLPTTICLLFIVSLISIFFIWDFNTVNTTKLDEVKLKENISNNSIAIMLEKEDKTGYKETNDNSFPTYSYMFNAKLSGCIDNAGNEIENALTFNYTNNTVKIKTIGSTSCYMYFDYLFDGEGTESEPYLIQNIEDLVELSNAVNEGNTYSNYYFSLTRTLNFEDTTSYVDSTTKRYGDINDNGIEEELLTELTTGSGFTPIGASELNMYFKGNFDGNNKTIENLYIINNKIVRSVGLFGNIENSIISNLNISGQINITVNADAGGIVGKGKNIIINNCKNYLNLTSELGSYSNGGIIGWTYGTSTISNSENYGSIVNSNNSGGLVGGNSENLTISNSCNYGTINNSKGHNLGGLIGRDNSSTNNTIILNSCNKGDIISNNDAINTLIGIGGMIGRIYGTLKIYDSYNENLISSTILDASNSNAVITVGGLLGNGSNNSNIFISESYNNGKIENGSRTGGLVGTITDNSKLIIDKSYNLADITSNSIREDNLYSTYVGGLLGYNYKSTCYILNSYNLNNITSIGIASGIVGAVNFGAKQRIINTYNTGNVIANLFFTSALTIVAKNENLVNNIFANNFYNLGSVTGPNNYVLYISNINTYDVKNTYHLDTISGSNVEGITTPMSESDMKSETFVNTLNNNLANINLSEIDESLAEYTCGSGKKYKQCCGK